MNDLPPKEEPTRVGEEMEAELKKESECVSGSQNNSGGVLVGCVYFYGKIVYKTTLLEVDSACSGISRAGRVGVAALQN